MDHTCFRTILNASPLTDFPVILDCVCRECRRNDMKATEPRESAATTEPRPRSLSLWYCSFWDTNVFESEEVYLQPYSASPCTQHSEFRWNKRQIWARPWHAVELGSERAELPNMHLWGGQSGLRSQRTAIPLGMHHLDQEKAYLILGTGCAETKHELCMTILKMYALFWEK